MLCPLFHSLFITPLFNNVFHSFNILQEFLRLTQLQEMYILTDCLLLLTARTCCLTQSWNLTVVEGVCSTELLHLCLLFSAYNTAEWCGFVIGLRVLVLLTSELE